jgi:hypothetical protein
MREDELNVVPRSSLLIPVAKNWGLTRSGAAKRAAERDNNCIAAARLEVLFRNI